MALNKRGLAGAVRPDEPDDLTSRNDERRSTDGLHSAEGDDDVVRLEHDVAHLGTGRVRVTARPASAGTPVATSASGPLRSARRSRAWRTRPARPPGFSAIVRSSSKAPTITCSDAAFEPSASSRINGEIPKNAAAAGDPRSGSPTPRRPR